jgi:hypothetical protein
VRADIASNPGQPSHLRLEYRPACRAQSISNLYTESIIQISVNPRTEFGVLCLHVLTALTWAGHVEWQRRTVRATERKGPRGRSVSCRRCSNTAIEFGWAVVDAATASGSSGQSSWLLTQRSRLRFPALPDFLSSSGSGTGSTQPHEDK